MNDVWEAVVFMVDGYANHVGISIPEYGLADLSLRGARVIPWEGTALPKGQRIFFTMKLSNSEAALAFLKQPGLLTPPIVAQEKKLRGWHLTREAPDFVRTLRNTRSKNPEDMNCVEWIVYGLELGGLKFSDDVMTPTEFLVWCRKNLENERVVE